MVTDKFNQIRRQIITVLFKQLGIVLIQFQCLIAVAEAQVQGCLQKRCHRAVFVNGQAYRAHARVRAQDGAPAFILGFLGYTGQMR